MGLLGDLVDITVNTAEIVIIPVAKVVEVVKDGTEFVKETIEEIVE